MHPEKIWAGWEIMVAGWPLVVYFLQVVIKYSNLTSDFIGTQ